MFYANPTPFHINNRLHYEKVLDYLGEDWRAVVRPEFRITGVKAVAESRGDDANVIVTKFIEEDDVKEMADCIKEDCWIEGDGFYEQEL